MTAFHELPDERRMALREVIEAAGGQVMGYFGDGVQVALPRPAGPCEQAAAGAGLKKVAGSLHYFPLGTDDPPAELRHDGRYPGSKGFWLFARFVIGEAHQCP
jgi:hypothetical protein